ncbi:Speckle-type POZ protein [Orchesella cincta]|uniref:Speckle-type POZ protein n=1 Tax=Orchesella cincta TaxID=48709 RepID=A0A1D2M2S1_ORCCI|nr:Speckle-type POZ protein [Orchesella cincta]
MFINLGSVSNAPVNQLTTEGFQMNLSEYITPEPVDNENPRINQYCKKLERILERKVKSNAALYLHLDWAPSHPKKVWLRLQGQLLETLTQICGKEIKLKVDGSFSFRDYYGNPAAKFKTGEMQIFLPSTLTNAPKKKCANAKKKKTTEAAQNPSSGEAFCEDTDVQTPNSDFNRLINTTLKMILNVQLLVEDEYLHQPARDSDELVAICKMIQQNGVHTDVTIMTADAQGRDSGLRANRCFLAVHRPVLKASLEGEFQESRTNQIETEYSVECVKSLLDYMYTLDFPEAVKCSQLAVELFQAANYYQIKRLEDKLVEMFLLRGNSWFDVNAAIELFQFAGKLDTNSSTELKAKTVEVLKSKPLDQLRQSENFKKLFPDQTAMDLCAMAFTK